MFWNDETPTSTLESNMFTDSATYAHSKGIIGFDSSTGFILTHSVPLFPELVSSGKKISLDFPDSETKFG